MAIKDLEYYQNLRTVITDSLLHLLIQAADSKRKLPVAKRNEMLVRFLKPKVKAKSIGCVKNDIKTMLSIGRRANGNLEKHLYQLLEMSESCVSEGVESLYNLLNHLEEDEGFESQLFNTEDEIKPETIYVLPDHLDHCYQGEKQVAPISALIQSKRSERLVEVINAHQAFRAELKEWNEQKQQAHLLLHPN